MQWTLSAIGSGHRTRCPFWLPGAGKSCYPLIYGAFWTIRCAERPMLRPKKLHYGWIVVGVTFITLLFGAGVRSAPGVLLGPLENEFQWSRAADSFAIAVNLLLYGLIGPFAAAMMEDRKSTRLN